MARACEICGRARSVGNNVSHANNRTRRVWKPNLQLVRANVSGTVRRILACARRPRSGRVVKVAGSRSQVAASA